MNSPLPSSHPTLHQFSPHLAWTPHLTNVAPILYKYSPYPSLTTNTYNMIILPTSHMDSLLTTLRLRYPPPDQRHH